MSTAALRHEPELDIDGFLAFLDGQEDHRWELHEGSPRPIVRPALPHARIVSNLIFHLRSSASLRGYDVLSDILIEADRRSGYSPDLSILPPSDDPRPTGHRNPLVLFEVLSPSTMDFDRAAKAKAYRAMPSLQQLVLVYQDSIRLESWVRGHDAWPLRPDIFVERDQVLHLPALSAFLPLADIDERVVPSPLVD